MSLGVIASAISENLKDKSEVPSCGPITLHLEKACTKCNQLKILDQFHKKPKGVLGRESHCKDCVSIRKRTKKAKRLQAKRASEANRRSRRSSVIEINEYVIKTSFAPCDKQELKNVMEDFVERIIWYRNQN